MRKVFALCVVLAFGVGLAQAGYLTPELKAKVDQAAPGQMLKVIVRMDRETDISIFPSNQQDAMVRHLQAFAGERQRDLLAALPGYGGKVAKVKPFWICNGIAMEATRDVVRDLATRSDVGYIDEDHIIKLEDTHSKDAPGINSVEWNINQISARQAWAAGYNGAGVVVGNMDTGVDVSHATFGGRWRGGGNSWFDGVNGQANPYDDHGHGTHTMGTICGGSGADTIGVARASTFVAAKAFNSGGSGQDSWILACYQWFAGTSRPNVFGNSWGNPTGSITTFWQASRNCQILGIHQAYSNGNSGPGAGTVGAPASHPHLIGVGATDASDAIASFSSRGPSPTFGAMESTANYLDPAWAASRRKPDLSAPGVSVRSAAPGGGWATMSGTSMASPHVTGVIGLMLQKNPNITEQQIWQILITSVDTPAPGRPYPNQNYGWGRLNAYRAVQMTPGSNQPNIYVNSNTVHDPPPGNNNGRWDPGETIGLIVALTNNGAVNATNVNARLRFNDSYITMTDSTNAYGNINSGQTVQGDSFIVRADPGTPQGHAVNFTMHITYTESLSGVDRQFSVTVGVPPTPPGAIRWGPLAAPGFPSSGFLYAVAYNGSNRIYVSNYYGRSYYAYSADSSLTSQGTWNAPDSAVSDFAWSPSDNMMWVHAGGTGGKRVYKINPTNGTVLRSFNTPAVDYPTGLTWDGSLLYPVDRRAFGNAQEYIYTCDTLGGNAVQHNVPVYTYATARCLAVDEYAPGRTLLMVNTFFNSAQGLDSTALYEINRQTFAFTGQRFLFTSGWNPRGVEFDPRVGDYWVTVPQGATSVNSIVKVRGFYQPSGAELEQPVRPGVPSDFLLSSARPNPMRQGTVISFGLPQESKVSLRVYNLAGQLVATLVDGRLPAGHHEARWDGRSQPSGVYFYRLEAGNFKATNRVVVVR